MIPFAPPHVELLIFYNVENGIREQCTAYQFATKPTFHFIGSGVSESLSKVTLLEI